MTQKEVDRLITNWQALLDAMPEMVMLIRFDFIIEYMNRSARECFGDLCTQECNQECKEILKETQVLRQGKESISAPREGDRFQETTINGVSIEYSAVPFVGYTGEQLIMMIMRDITERKRHEAELQAFHLNIEKILDQKIADLRESEQMRKQLSNEVNSLKNQLGQHHHADKMIGSCRKMRELREMIFQVAKTDATVLITGESGTGKELVANLIKEASNRAGKPFLKINCNTINDSILESDLFGYEKGAFTGATALKKGKFEVVDGGTIFLDEIGDISPRMQASLLRVLQNGEVVRVGGTKPIKVNVRVLAATNVDLATAVQEKKFRLDLYYRLNIINVDIPPLRVRKEDIVDLVSHFVAHYREAFKKDIDFVPQTIINRLLLHDWPGNVRELENMIQRAVLMAKGSMITGQDLIFDQNLSPSHDENTGFDFNARIGEVSLKDMLADVEADVIREALKKYGVNVTDVASQLEIGKTALYDKMKRYGISAKEMKRES